MTKVTILRFSKPASPRRDIKPTPTWRLAHVGVTQAWADDYVAKALRPGSLKIVAAGEVRNYL